MAPSIPDRWIPYKACGAVINGTRIVCFKVPLKRSVQIHNKEIDEIWDIKALLKKLPNLCAVIDLTNTNRYYDPKELQAAGVLHRKILMPGRVIPPERKVKEFMDAMDKLLGNNCDALVGVHCTHGLNRTGYMVCRYLRDRLQMPAKVAIKKFEKARGYKIERENYLADLLGKEPPSPDLGKHTDLKPIGSDDKMSYKTPLSSYEEEAEGYSIRFQRKREFVENDSSNSRGGKRDSKRRKNSSDSDWSDCKRSYNYIYDY